MIYVFDEMNKIDDSKLTDLKKYLSGQRADKAFTYRRIIDQKTSILVYLLLRYALFKECDMTDIPEFLYSKGKKPYIPDTDIHFNLSHCKFGVMCGLSAGNIGIDIQDKITNYTNIRKSVLTADEIAVTDTPEKFTDIWTLKEAYGKYTAEGITYDMKNHSFNGIVSGWNDRWGLKFYSENRGRYSIAACCTLPTDIINVSFEELSDFLNSL